MVGVLMLVAAALPASARPSKPNVGVREKYPINVGVEGLGRGAAYSVQIEGYLNNVVGVGVDAAFVPDGNGCYLRPTATMFFFFVDQHVEPFGIWPGFALGFAV